MSRGEIMSTPYDTLQDFTATDWTAFIGGVVLIILGVFVAGRQGQDGPIANQFGLSIWSGRNFSTALLLGGLSLLGWWLSNRLDEGMLVNFLGDGSTDFATTVGLLTAIAMTCTVVVVSMIESDSFLPNWVGPAIGFGGFLVLFASGLTTAVNGLYNEDFTGGSWADWLPLIPLNIFVASVWATLLGTYAVAALNGVIMGTRRFADGLTSSD